MLTGRHAYELVLQNLASLVYKQRTEDPPSVIAAGLPSFLDDRIRGATAKEPAKRFRGMWAFAQELKAARASLKFDSTLQPLLQRNAVGRYQPLVRPNPDGWTASSGPQPLRRGDPPPNVVAARVILTPAVALDGSSVIAGGERGAASAPVAPSPVGQGDRLGPAVPMPASPGAMPLQPSATGPRGTPGMPFAVAPPGAPALGPHGTIAAPRPHVVDPAPAATMKMVGPPPGLEQSPAAATRTSLSFGPPTAPPTTRSNPGEPAGAPERARRPRGSRTQKTIVFGLVGVAGLGVTATVVVEVVLPPASTQRPVLASDAPAASNDRSAPPVAADAGADAGVDVTPPAASRTR